MNMQYTSYHSAQRPRSGTRSTYAAPENVQEVSLSGILGSRGGEPLQAKQLDLMLGRETVADKRVFYSGDLANITSPAVAIVGTRHVSSLGAARARRLARALAKANVAVVSGLAEGVDTEALTEAIAAGGRVAAVIGTPINKAYPAKNAALQETIYREHLLLSQFKVGERTYPSNFPERNRLMTAVTDATVVIEASDSSGTLHQSAECQRLGRWLFIAKSLVDDPNLSWPRKFRSYEKCIVLENVEDVLSRVLVGCLA